ncbi:hypothetical protein NQ315_005246 [Exocentrus adspersus]|uniref:Uncharacterized protein n=1 Tax=Exocentrus adspersus TaxID=1586481 RepID=A0AAV8W1G1_9CUCU|nr:hypothetical protein NQ315_005246 [Exocentrus adspersus]
MVGKAVLVFGVAIFAVFAQVYSFETGNNDDVPIVRNDAEKILKKLKAAVDKAMEQAQKALDDAEKKIQEKAAAIESSAEADMQTNEKTQENAVAQQKQKATDADVSIDDCLTGNEDKLVNLPAVYTQEMVTCTNAKISDGVSYAQDALNKVQNIVNEVENIKQEIKDCGHGLKAVKCIAKLAVKIEKDITSLPTKIETDIAATVVMIAQLEQKVNSCASDNVSKSKSEGDAVVAAVTTCVAGKIPA